MLEATGAVTANLSSSGRDGDELIRNMGGEVTVSSHNGIIRKWNLLSKILGVLNVYDFFRGKVNLLQKGLPYTKAGLTLKGENGLFKTEDFLIDSSAMVIAGEGTINLPGETVDGKLIVSPTGDTRPCCRQHTDSEEVSLSGKRAGSCTWRLM